MLNIVFVILYKRMFFIYQIIELEIKMPFYINIVFKIRFFKDY